MKLYIKQEDVKNIRISYSSWNSGPLAMKNPTTQHTEFDVDFDYWKHAEVIKKLKNLIGKQEKIKIFCIENRQSKKFVVNVRKYTDSSDGSCAFKVSFIQSKPYKPKKKKPSLHDVFISAGMKECYIKPEVTFGIAGEKIKAGDSVFIIKGKAYKSKKTIDGGRKATEVEILKGNAFWDHNKMAWWIK